MNLSDKNQIIWRKDYPMIMIVNNHKRNLLSIFKSNIALFSFLGLLALTGASFMVANQSGLFNTNSRAAIVKGNKVLTPELRSDVFNQDGGNDIHYNNTETRDNWLGTGRDRNDSYLGLRFKADSIPKNAIVTRATLTFFSAKDQWIGTSMNISAEKSTNPATFSDSSLPSARQTVGSVTYSKDQKWRKNKQYNIDVTSAVYELYKYGNTPEYVSLILEGTGRSYGRKFIYSTMVPKYAPRLIVDYTYDTDAVPSIPPTQPPDPTLPPSALEYDVQLSGAFENPAVSTNATGVANVVLNGNTATVSLEASGLSSSQTMAHIHGPAALGANANVLFTLPNGNFTNHTITLTNTQVQQMKNGQMYINVHTQNNPNGEIRGQINGSVGGTIPTTTPTPTKRPTPTTAPNVPTATPIPGGGTSAVGKCGESMDFWHPPVVNGCATGHEHGDAPPQWIADAGYTLSFAGPFNTSATENVVKHTSMKGYLVRFNNTDIYVRYHWASNPQERFGTFHSYEVFARDSSGNVSHWQLWNNVGPATDDRLRFLRRPGVRGQGEPDGHMEVVDRQSGSNCEQWYSKPRGYDARFGWGIGLTICGVNAYYQRELEQDSATVFDQSTWDIAGGLGLTRRIELSFNPNNVPAARGRFWSTQFGQLVSGPNDPRCSANTTAFGVAYKNICLEQVIQPTMPSIQFPNNSIQRTFPGQGVQIPN